MLYEVTGDLVSDKKFDIFCHQTNCKGVLGAGIALQIKNAYPEVAEANDKYVSDLNAARIPILGTNLYIKTHDGRTCVNMYAQESFGRGPFRYTDYNALNSCMSRLEHKLRISFPDMIVGFPKGIGCGLGGGDWNIVRRMIRALSEIVIQDIYIVELVKQNDH